VDASGSSDADGDSLTFSWSQTSGPSAVINNAQSDIATITLPEVSSDAVLTFEVSVSDGTVSSTSSIDLTSLDIVLTPTVDVFGARAAGVQGLENPRGVSLYATDAFSGTGVRLAGVEDDGSGLSFFYFAKGAGETLGGDQPALLQGVAGEEVSRTRMGFFGAEVIGLRSRDEVLFYLHNGGSVPYELAATGSISDPCAVQELQYSGQEAVAVGTGNGIDVALFSSVGSGLQFDSTIEVSASGDFCELATAAGGYKIYAVDADTKILHVWEVFQSTASATEYASTDLALAAGDVVTAIEAYQFVRAGTYYIPVLVTDGAHDGHHRLLIYKESSGVTEFVTSFSWDKGIPTGVALEFDQSSGQGRFIVNLENTPYALVVGVVDDAFTSPEPVFSFDGYAPISLGVSDISITYNFVASETAYVATNAAAGEIDILRRAN
jgi:hypothetical protein